MFENIFTWVKNIVFYLILLTMITHLLPGKKYQKYVKLFTGMLLVIIVIGPITQLFKWDQIFDFHYMEKSYEQEVASMAEKMEEMQTIQQSEILEEYKEQIKMKIAGFVSEQGMSLVFAYIDIVEDETDSRYLFPDKMQLVVTNENAERIVEPVEIAVIDISGEKNVDEEGSSVEVENLKNTIAHFYNMETTNININVQG